ncbi:hypothetical protein [Blastococcus sp. PRF04-17]|uniref:hypothetical protein n=1 Tax=Blastococcus sp. PRF04-17 TaxID=2933797 RepID=UPI001FF43C3A|nr:hypothetical protein [Blastococcus sp. PRF04-17]UOY03039.1 hypothetical protein MVA48_06735 [Blastococcus sp. PRF04-17]
MDAVVVIALVAVTATSAVVMVVAMALWIREVLRSRDGETDRRLGEPSPVDLRAVPMMAVTAGVLLGVQYMRGARLSYGESAFAALFAGFALSAAWYLLARRSRSAETGRVQGVSALAAAGFGALWGLAAS